MPVQELAVKYLEVMLLACGCPEIYCAMAASNTTASAALPKSAVQQRRHLPGMAVQEGSGCVCRTSMG